MIGIDYGLCFHIDMRLTGNVKTHFIKTALASSLAEQPILGSFGYEIPESIPHGPRRLGASETLGIFGGVEDSAQRLLSEVIERNIGDALTLALVHFLVQNRESLDENHKRRLLVLGPPIPKILGRFASLRIPRSLDIGWFYCFPPPEWLSSFPGWSTISRAGHHLSRLWMEDELIVEDFKLIEGVEYRVAWMNQYIEYNNVYSDDWIEATMNDLSPTPWVDANVKLPPVLSLAALYALAERIRSKEGHRGSPVEVVAAASLEESDDSSQLLERVDRLHQVIKDKDIRGKFHEAHRGSEPLTIQDLKDVEILWNEIKSPTRITPKII